MMAKTATMAMTSCMRRQLATSRAGGIKGGNNIRVEMLLLPRHTPSSSYHHHQPSWNRTFSTTTLENHTMNCSLALKKSHESDSFKNLSKSHVEVLQGIGPKGLDALQKLGITTIQDLAQYKYYHLSKSLYLLSLTEVKGDRNNNATLLNVNKGLDKAYETKSLQEICQAPVSALQGLSDEKGLLWKDVGTSAASDGVVTIQDLAQCKFCHWAESIITLAKYEEEVIVVDDSDA